MEAIVFIVFLLALLIGIPFAIYTAKQTNENWRRAATRLGLVFSPGGFLKSRKISGRYRGSMHVTVSTFTRGSGKNRTTYTRFRVLFPRALGLGLRIRSEGFFTGVTKFFGAQDVQVNDPEFDAAFLIKGADPHGIVRFLTPARRARIHRLLRTFSRARIDDHGVEWVTRGTVRQADRIVSIVRQFANLAAHLISEPERDREMESALKAKHDGQLEEALKAISRDQQLAAEAAEEEVAVPAPSSASEAEATPAKHVDEHVDELGPAAAEKPPAATDQVDENLLKGEILYLGDRREEAREAFAAALEEAPEDPEAQGWVKKMSEPAPSASASASMASTWDTVDLTVAAVCDALFGEGRSSFEATRIFESEYQEAPVSWTGRLRRVDTYSFDFVFGNQPGVKATFEVHEITGSAFTERQALAIVQLPADTEPLLRDRVGDSFTFSGTLAKVDGLMKNVYVRDGSLDA